VLAGIGLGFGYIVPVATLVKWFPDKRGMITGIAEATMAVGPEVTKNSSSGITARGEGQEAGAGGRPGRAGQQRDPPRARQLPRHRSETGSGLSRSSTQ
jgi:hypothetical protein